MKKLDRKVGLGIKSKRTERIKDEILKQLNKNIS